MQYSNKERHVMELKTIPIDTMVPNRFQPRLHFEEESLRELAESIKERGLLEPIIVRKRGNKYQIIAGERRWRAAAMIGLKEIPVIIRSTAEEDDSIESLMENLHRKDLTDVEREDAIHKMWISKRFKTKSEMANALGLSRKTISDDIDAWEFRHENNVREAVPTYIVARTSGLENNIRKRVIQKFEESTFSAIAVYSVVKTIKKGSDLLKNELLESESAITPKIAEMIVESLPSHSAQNVAVRAIKRQKLSAGEVEDLVSRIQTGKNTSIQSNRIVAEIDTGYLFKCPKCGRSYRIFHNEPTETHSFREMS
jgi:ParB/RepB/Spo0J family partition protein